MKKQAFFWHIKPGRIQAKSELTSKAPNNNNIKPGRIQAKSELTSKAPNNNNIKPGRIQAKSELLKKSFFISFFLLLFFELKKRTSR